SRIQTHIRSDQTRRNRKSRGTSDIASRCRLVKRKHVRRHSMTNRFLISAAAIALIASGGFANAQGTGMGRESGGAAAQQSAPSGGNSAAPSNRHATEPSGSGSGMKGAQSEEKSSTVGQSQRGEEKTAPGQKPKGMSSETETKGGKDMKTEGREGRDRDQNAQSRERNGNMNAETKSQTTTTTGQAGAGAKLSSEQRTKITSVIRNERVESVNNVDFNISVGTRVPRERVHLYPLPREVVAIYPEWRGYEFIRVRDQIL